MTSSSAHRAAVIGQPVAHSLSPALHLAAYRALGLDDWDYTRWEVAPDQLEQVLDTLRQPAGAGPTWEGLSVTMPHKQRLLEAADVVDPLAQAVGAANTVVAQRSQGGALLAVFNTDVAGIVGAVRETARSHGRALPEPGLAAGLRALVLGSGATACSAMAALTQLGCDHITVAARRHAGPGRAASAAHRMGLEVETLTWRPGEEPSDGAVAQVMGRADLVVSTLPAGAADTLADALARLPRLQGEAGNLPVLLDVVYAPWPTPLAQAWKAGGGAIAPGWLMLLHQAVDQVRLMTGHNPPLEPMRQALRQALAAR